MIKLDEKFRIEPDTNAGWRLITKITKKDKEGVEYETEDVLWYLPSLQMILHKYVEESSKALESVEDVLKNLKKINNAIERVSKIYVSDGKLIQV